MLCRSAANMSELHALTSPRLYTVRPPRTMGNTGRPVESSGIGWTSLLAPPSATFRFLDIFLGTVREEGGVGK